MTIAHGSEKTCMNFQYLFEFNSWRSTKCTEISLFFFFLDVCFSHHSLSWYTARQRALRIFCHDTKIRWSCFKLRYVYASIWYMKSGGQIFYLSSVTIKQSQCCGVTFSLYRPWCLYFCCKYDLTYGLINYYALPRIVSCMVLISLFFLVQYLWIWIH